MARFYTECEFTDLGIYHRHSPPFDPLDRSFSLSPFIVGPGAKKITYAFHELAHTMLATRNRRGRKHYGLGPLDNLSAKKASVDEEELASALGIHMLWKWGFREEAREEFQDQYWDNSRLFLDKLRKALVRAERLNRSVTE